MDLFLLILSAMLIILGIIGSFIPILPGPLTSWFGLFILNLISTVEIDKTLLIITFIIALIVFVYYLAIAPFFLQYPILPFIFGFFLFYIAYALYKDVIKIKKKQKKTFN